MAPPGDHGPPPVFADVASLFPTRGRALELACGRGRAAVWLAQRGMEVWGVDVSPVAIDLARRLAAESGVADRCRFDVHDLDGGLPPGPPVGLILCHLFRDPALDAAVVERLAPGAILAMSVLSAVDAGPGAFRASPGALTRAFSSLDVRVHVEADGIATIVARKGTAPPG